MENTSSDCYNSEWSQQGKILICDGKFVIANFGLGTILQKTFSVPPNRKLRFNVTIYKIDSWDYEPFQIKENGNLLDQFTYKYDDGTHICPEDTSNVPWPDLFVDKSFEFTDDSSEITIELHDYLKQEIWDESWGFRKVSLEVMIPCVNFFSSCNFSGDLFQICSGSPTQLQKDFPFVVKSFKMVSGTVVTLKDSINQGEGKIYTESQSCIDDFQFPKEVPSE